MTALLMMSLASVTAITTVLTSGLVFIIKITNMSVNSSADISILTVPPRKTTESYKSGFLKLRKILNRKRMKRKSFHLVIQNGVLKRGKGYGVLQNRGVLSGNGWGYPGGCSFRVGRRDALVSRLLVNLCSIRPRKVIMETSIILI